MAAIPWNANRGMREVIIENHEPAVKRRDLEMLGKSIDAKLKALHCSESQHFKKLAHQAKCNERRLLKKLRGVELLEIIRDRRGRGGRRDELELLLLAGLDGEGTGGDDTALLAAALLDERGGRGGGGERRAEQDIEMMMLNNRVNRIANNVTQLDTLLGVRPINLAAPATV